MAGRDLQGCAQTGTGRAGNTGVAIAFYDSEEKTDLRDIEKLIGRKIYVIEKHPFPLIPGADTLKKKPVRRFRSR